METLQIGSMEVGVAGVMPTKIERAEMYNDIAEVLDVTGNDITGNEYLGRLGVAHESIKSEEPRVNLEP